MLRLHAAIVARGNADTRGYKYFILFLCTTRSWGCVLQVQRASALEPCSQESITWHAIIKQKWGVKRQQKVEVCLYVAGGKP